MFEAIIAFVNDNALWIGCGVFLVIAVMVAVQLLAERLAFKMLRDELDYEDYESLNVASR